MVGMARTIFRPRREERGLRLAVWVVTHAGLEVTVVAGAAGDSVRSIELEVQDRTARALRDVDERDELPWCRRGVEAVQLEPRTGRELHVPDDDGVRLDASHDEPERPSLGGAEATQFLNGANHPESMCGFYDLCIQLDWCAPVGDRGLDVLAERNAHGSAASRHNHSHAHIMPRRDCSVKLARGAQAPAVLILGGGTHYSRVHAAVVGRVPKQTDPPGTTVPRCCPDATIPATNVG
eukprot:COSAG01_NODE_5775_length_4039_cov_1388.135025_2_plen_237_part_00